MQAVKIIVILDATHCMCMVEQLEVNSGLHSNNPTCTQLMLCSIPSA